MKLMLETEDLDFSKNREKLISKNPETKFVFISCRILNFKCFVRYTCLLNKKALTMKTQIPQSLFTEYV